MIDSARVPNPGSDGPSVPIVIVNPNQLEDKRRYPRFRVSGYKFALYGERNVLGFQRQGPQEIGPQQILDLSEGGARILSTQWFPKGTPFYMDLELFKFHERIQARGVVRWIQRKGDAFEFGLEFTRIDPKERDRIKYMSSYFSCPGVEGQMAMDSQLETISRMIEATTGAAQEGGRSERDGGTGRPAVPGQPLAEKKEPLGLPPRSLRQARVSVKLLAQFTRQLAAMLGGGVTITRALEVQAEQMPHRVFRAVINDLHARIQAGSDLSGALEKYPRCFDTIYVNLVRSGEISGQLDRVLVRLAEYLESVHQLRQDIRSAVIYPVFSLVFVLGLAFALTVFVIPRFEEIFRNLNIERLPLLTQAMIDVSAFLRTYPLPVIAGVAAVFFFLKFFLSYPPVQLRFHKFLLTLPIFGPLFEKVAMSRVSRTLQTLLDSGLEALSALEIGARVAGNRWLEKALLSAKEEVRAGGTISDGMARQKAFPPMVVQMVCVGEESGTVPDMLGKVADFYESEVRATVRALTSTLEPVLIITIGAVVGTIILAVFLPIVQLQQKLTGM